MVTLDVLQLAFHDQRLGGARVELQSAHDPGLGRRQVPGGDEDAGRDESGFDGLGGLAVGVTGGGKRGVGLAEREVCHGAHRQQGRGLLGGEALGGEVAQQIAEAALRHVDLRERRVDVAGVEPAVARGLEFLFGGDRIADPQRDDAHAVMGGGIVGVVAQGAAQFEGGAPQVALVDEVLGAAQGVADPPVFPPQRPARA